MEVKEIILDSAGKLFLNKGVKSVTMDDIASEVSMSKRTIYECFTDKENLLEECIEYFYAQLVCREEKISKKAENVMEEFALLLEQWDDFKMLAIEGFMGDIKDHYPRLFHKTMKEKHSKREERFIQTLQRGIDEGMILPDINIDFTVIVFGQFMHKIMANPKIFISDKRTFAQAFRYIFIQFIRGIATTKGIEAIDSIRSQNKF